MNISIPDNLGVWFNEFLHQDFLSQLNSQWLIKQDAAISKKKNSLYIVLLEFNELEKTIGLILLLEYLLYRTDCAETTTVSCHSYNF